MTNAKKKRRSPFGTVDGYDKFLAALNQPPSQPQTTQNQTGKNKQNQTQNSDETDTKQLQTGNTNSDKTVTNSDKTVTKGHKTVTKGHKTETKELQKSDKTVTPKKRNSAQTLHTSPENYQIKDFDPDELYKLSGPMKQIFFYIVNCCHQRNSLSTHPINNKKLSDILSIKYSNVKQCILRLKDRCLISSKKSKTGRGGFNIIEISEVVKLSALSFQKNNHETVTKQTRNGYEMVTKQPQPETLVVSSYSTTTNMNKEFQNIDTSSLLDIGFSQSHIIQVHREYEKNPDLALPADIVQESINALAFDLKHNNVAQDFKKSPAVVLTALLKKGKPYSSKTPEKYMTPAEEAMRDYLAAKEIRHKNKLAVESKIKEIEYQEWLSCLPAEELMELVPESEVADVPEKLRKTLRRRKALELSKEYFEAEIWPSKHQALLAEVVEPA